MTRPLKKILLRAALLPILLAGPAPALSQVTDPITAEATGLIDGSGLLARQSRIGEGVILLERQLRHAETIGKLIELLGPDAEIEVAPGEFMRFSETPAGLRARIEMARLQRELERMSAPTQEVPSARPARDDGSDLIELIDRRLTQLERAGTEETPQEEGTEQARPLSLREIFGSGTDLSAILQYGADRVRVRAGDSLIGGLRVLSVEPDGVRVTQRGQELHLRLPN
jgi:type IV pilus biogenesis protein PilP